MSMAYVALATAVIGAGASVYSADKGARAQKATLMATKQAAKDARKVQGDADTLAEREKNKANKKRSNAEQYTAAAALASSKGSASTLKTGGGGTTMLLGGGGSLLTS